MPFYYAIKDEPEDVKRRIADRLLKLRKQLRSLPRRSISDSLLLATWNIREFDSEKYGERTPESLHYIAEIISHFDLVAIQEVREDLSALDKVQAMLGGWWKYIVTDVTEGTSGNGERMAFLFDGRKVTFGGLAGEIVLPSKGKDPVLQFARTPFICGFRSGWVKFNLCTVHIYYGKSVAEDPRRLREIEDLARLLAERADPPALKQPERPDGLVTAKPNKSPENLILLGDFNIFSTKDKTYGALIDAGFTIPKELTDLGGSNLGRSKHFDQIAFHVRPDRFATTGTAGIVNFSESVFRDDEEQIYVDAMGADYAKKSEGRDRTNYYRQWRTFQMSDHLLLWVELKIDYGEEYLARIRDGEEAPPRDVEPRDWSD